MRFDIYHHFAGPDPDEIIARLDGMQSAISALIAQGVTSMATTQELLDAVNALAAAFQPLPAAIDALEDAVAAIPGIPATDQANIDAAVEALKAITTAVAAAVTDATDGLEAGPGE
jgi:uncharacterized protein YoxC